MYQPVYQKGNRGIQNPIVGPSQSPTSPDNTGLVGRPWARVRGLVRFLSGTDHGHRAPAQPLSWYAAALRGPESRPRANPAAILGASGQSAGNLPRSA